MSLGTALNTAMAGLAANQASMAVVSSNVANAQTPGYVARTANQGELESGTGASVRVYGVKRELDAYVQSQLRTETGGAGYARQMASVLTQLQSVYGTPGQTGSLENALSTFTTALQSLAGSSGDASAQGVVLGAAQTLTQTLNSATRTVQSLRSNAEQSLSGSVSIANDAITQIASFNQRLLGMTPSDPVAATLMDQRDNAVNQLSELLDVRVIVDSKNQASVYTSGGLPLVNGPLASSLSFDARGLLDAGSQWNADPAQSAVGSLKLVMPNGGSIDLTSGNAVISGKMAADLKLRDQTLVQAQAQLDQFAAMLASSLSTVTKSGTAATAGGQSGFDFDLSAVLPGNSINLTYTDTANVQRQVSLVRVDDAGALPLANTGGVQRIGINFSGGNASVVSQLNTALGAAGLSFSNPTGNTLRVLNGASPSAVNAASSTTTATALATGAPQLAVFTDGNTAYSGAITARGTQMLGFAGRISVNSNLLADPSKLTTYSTNPQTQLGDNTRADYLFQQLQTATTTVSPATGLGSAATPFSSTLKNYMQQFISLQSNASTSATALQAGQDVVVSTLQSKFNTNAGVSIDKEMSDLIALQNTYAANAQVMSVVQQMMNSLLQAVV